MSKKQTVNIYIYACTFELPNWCDYFEKNIIHFFHKIRKINVRDETFPRASRQLYTLHNAYNYDANRTLNERDSENRRSTYHSRIIEDDFFLLLVDLPFAEARPVQFK